MDQIINSRGFFCPNSIHYFNTTFTSHMGRKFEGFAAKRTHIKLPKIQEKLNSDSILQPSSRGFEDCNTFLGTPRSFSNRFPTSKHQESRATNLTVCNFFLNLFSLILSLSTCYKYIFMLVVRFAMGLDDLIWVYAQELWNTILRVSKHVLGFFYIGKIMFVYVYHGVPGLKLSWSMVFIWIYCVCSTFFKLAGLQLQTLDRR